MQKGGVCVDRDDRVYLLRLSLAFLAYLAVLYLSVAFIRSHPFTPWRLPIAVSPVIPALYAVVAFARYLGSMDELQRHIQLEAMAFAFGGTAIGTFGYGFLERVGLPHLNWLYVWPFMVLFWGIGLLLANRRYQ